MSLLEISAKKRAEIRQKCENKVKQRIDSASGTHVNIETNSHPANRRHELDAERQIIGDILNKAGLQFHWTELKKMGWTEWQYSVIFLVTLV